MGLYSCGVRVLSVLDKKTVVGTVSESNWFYGK